MKISSEQLRALQEQERLNKKPGLGGGAFDEILSGQMVKASGADMPQQAGPATRIAAPLSLDGSADGNSDLSDRLGQDLLREATDRMEGMFDALDSYAAQLASNSGNLRQTYGLLQDMGQQLADFKASFSDATRQQPELAAMLNEVDVLVTTETFKFNRGDYA